MRSDYDFVVIHDPQPCAMHASAAAGGSATRWIWRCHIDTSTPDEALYEYLLPYIRRYDRAIYTVADFVPTGSTCRSVCVAAGDRPAGAQEHDPRARRRHYIVRQFGIDVDRPLLLQVSRFDPWKDPLGVVDAYRAVKQRWPDVQLALIGSMASDDPEGWDYLESSPPTWAATPTSSCSPTSTTSAASRSTPSSRTPPSCCRSRPARALA